MIRRLLLLVALVAGTPGLACLPSAAQGRHAEAAASGVAPALLIGDAPVDRIDPGPGAALAGRTPRPLRAAEAAEPAAPSAAPEPGEVLRDCKECGEMVVIPAGEFDMGGDTPYEKPDHRVTIAAAFAIGRREVTFDEFDLCVAAGACRQRPEDHGWGRGTQPVIDVSWDDAKAFAGWLARRTGRKYRLPSEAEWEYAARGGTSRANAIRPGARFRYDQDVRYYANGFRVARDLK